MMVAKRDSRRAVSVSMSACCRRLVCVAAATLLAISSVVGGHQDSPELVTEIPLPGLV